MAAEGLKPRRLHPGHHGSQHFRRRRLYDPPENPPVK